MAVNKPPELSQVTAIVKTFERKKCVDRLVRSLRRFYPEMPVLVGDDSKEPSPRHDVEYLRLPFDLGVSAGRNAMLREVRTPYFLLLDDDLVFTANTRIERLLELVAADEVDLAAGDYCRCKRKLGFTVRRPQPYHGTMDVRSGTLTLRCGGLALAEGYTLCDIVHNFFVARTEQILALRGWCEVLKTQEHEEFFFRFNRAGLKAAYCPDVVVEHWQVRPPRYTRFRDRDYWPLAAREIGVTRINFMDGTSREFPEVAKQLRAA